MPSVYLGKPEYDSLIRRGDDPSKTVTELVRAHLESNPKPKARKK